MPGGQCCGVVGRSRSASARMASVAAAKAGGGEAARRPQIVLLVVGRPKPRGGPTNCSAATAIGIAPQRPAMRALHPKRRPPPSNFLLPQSTSDCSVANVLGFMRGGAIGVTNDVVRESALLPVACMDAVGSRGGAIEPVDGAPVSAWTATVSSDLSWRFGSRIMKASRSNRTAKWRGGRVGPQRSAKGPPVAKKGGSTTAKTEKRARTNTTVSDKRADMLVALRLAPRGPLGGATVQRLVVMRPLVVLSLIKDASESRRRIA